jgi:hypothetical protein
MTIFSSNQSVIATNNLSRISFFEKVYIWSLIFEPIMLLNTSIYFLSPASRLIQISFFSWYIIKIILQKINIPCIRISKKYYIYIYCYLFIVFFSSTASFLFGYYNINLTNFNVIYRPFFEFIILLIYLFYFVILPRFILKTEAHLTYLLDWIIKVFYVVLIIGLVDYFFDVFYTIDIIPIHFFTDDLAQAGGRFHSILGEPRDAFVYLSFIIPILFLKSSIKKTKRPHVFLLAIIIICAGLTFSTSGLVSIIFSISLIFFFHDRLNLKKFFILSIILLFSVVVFYGLISFIPRIERYFIMFLSLQNPNLFSDPNTLPYLVRMQAPDIIPMIEIYNRLLEFNFFHLFFGSGIGSTSYFLNDFFEYNISVVDNPRSQFVRLLFENGILGLWIFLLALIKPINLLKEFLSKKDMYMIYITSCFLIGASLGHRSHLTFLFIGILIAFISIKCQSSNRIHIKNINNKV